MDYNRNSKEVFVVSNIILDSLTLDTSLQFVDTVGKGNFNETQIDCFNNFLTGIVLWDKLSFPSSVVIENIFKKLDGDGLTTELRKFVTPLETSILQSLSFVLIDYGFGGSPEELDEFLLRCRKCDFTPQDISLLSQRTDMYLDLSSISGSSYYPHPLRADYLIDNGQRNKHNREALLRRLESNIDEYSESSAFHFRTSILYDFIKNEAGDAPREQLLYALKLRNEKDVIKFRKSLDKFEQKYKPGSVHHTKISHKEIDDIANEVFNKYNRNKNKKVSMDVNASYGVSGPGIGMSIRNMYLPVIGGKKSDIDKKFIYRLLTFGLNERE
jgi:hypothetical protein